MKKISIPLLVLVGLALHVPWPAAADGLRVPPLLGYQSILYDDGGNVIEDGPVDVSFRITDADGGVLYEEHQRLEAIYGHVSALVGNGLTPDGAPAGGIPHGVFSPEGPRYLEVEADGFLQAQQMEVASVPYSVYADVALGAAADAIDSNAIADGSLRFDDLSEELIDRLVDRLAGGQGGVQFVLRGDLESMYRGPEAAATIGVRPGLNYSGANDLQGVLQDLDSAVRRREEHIVAEAEANVAALAAETAARMAADADHASAASGIHGIQGSIVGTENAQTLTNKTLQDPSVSGGMNMGGYRITSLADPVDSNDAAKKGYVDMRVDTATASVNADISNLESYPRVMAYITRGGGSDCTGDCDGYNVTKVEYQTLAQNADSRFGWSTCPPTTNNGCRYVTVEFNEKLSTPYAAIATPVHSAKGDDVAIIRHMGGDGLVIELRDPADTEGHPSEVDVGVSVVVIK